MKIDPKWKISDNEYRCPVCTLIFSKKGIYSHVWRKHTLGIHHKPFLGKTNISWNKGLNKETNTIISKSSKKISNTLKEKIQDGELFGIRKWIKEFPNEAKKAQSKGGGYRPTSGRSKGSFSRDSFGNRVWLQSSYEIKCADILSQLNIQWVRPSPLNYVLDGRNRKYYPDFLLVDYNIYLDPKNSYKKQLDDLKILETKKQNNVIIEVLLLEHITQEYILSLIGRVTQR